MAQQTSSNGGNGSSAHVQFHHNAAARAHRKDFMYAAVSHDDAVARIEAGQWCGFDGCAGATADTYEPCAQHGGSTTCDCGTPDGEVQT